MSDIYCACDILCNIFLLVFFRVVFFTMIIIVVFFFCSQTHITITIEFGSTQHITMGIRRDRVSRLFRRYSVQLQDGRCNDSTGWLPVHILTQIRERGGGRLSRRNVGRHITHDSAHERHIHDDNNSNNSNNNSKYAWWSNAHEYSARIIITCREIYVHSCQRYWRKGLEWMKIRKHFSSGYVQRLSLRRKSSPHPIILYVDYNDGF